MCLFLVPHPWLQKSEDGGDSSRVSKRVGWEIISAVKTKHKILAVVIVKLTINEVLCWVLIIKPTICANFSNLFLE